MKLNEVADPKYMLYLDLDGVFADLTTYVEHLLGHKIKTQSDGNWANDDEIWEQLREMDEPKFNKLPQLEDAMVLWEFVKDYPHKILTATGKPADRNAAMKREWIKNNLPGHGPIITVEKSKLKAEHAAENHILVDDRTKSTRPWKQAGGIAIHHKSAAKTIEALKKYGF